MDCEKMGLNSGLPRVVLVASLEHGVVDENVESKVVVGGLGKKWRVRRQHHPGVLVSAHPSFATRSQRVFPTVSGRIIAQNAQEGCQGYDPFTGSCSAARTPETRAALYRLRPNVCQCPVCHTAMTRLYVKRTLPIVFLQNCALLGGNVVFAPGFVAKSRGPDGWHIINR